MTEGFRSSGLGFTPVAAVEWDLAAAATYAMNFGEAHTHWCDIANFAPNGPADVVIGGPPCQGFSGLGSRDVDDPRNLLWREYMRVVLEANPEVFVIENVDRFRRSSEFALLMQQLASGSLRKWKFHEAKVLNAADFGAPQRRNRTILIASRVGPVEFPKPTHGKDPTDGRLPWVPLRSALADVPWRTETTHLPSTNTTVFGQSVPGVFKSSQLHVGRKPTDLSLKRYACIHPGGGRFNLPPELLSKCWREKPTGTTDVMGRLQWDHPSVTIRTEFFKPEKGRYLHPQWDAFDPANTVDRAITHLEAARIQTFPDEFEWCGTKGQIARQIGNAVPPVLARAIAEAIHARLS